MSFLKNLGKNFLKSAVNQVGRDGGKIVSNNLYGTSHATPVKVATESSEVEEGDFPYIDIPEYNLFRYLVCLFICLYFAPYGSVLMILGFFKNRDITIKKVNEVSYAENKIKDLRYKCGYRFGEPILKLTPKYIKANKKQIEKANFKSKIYFTIGIIGLIYTIIRHINLHN